MTFGLTCAACATDAVTFTVTRGADGKAQQVVMSSDSPVTVFRSLAGPGMQDLLALLEAGDGEYLFSSPIAWLAAVRTRA